MKDFLQKLKIIDFVDFELNTTKEAFTNSFKKNVDESDLSFSDGMLEALTRSKNEYKGNISRNSFHLRRRRKFFDTNKNVFAVANGELVEKDSQLLIKTEINGFHNSMKFFYLFIIAIYVIVLFGFILNFATSSDSLPLVAVPFLLLHASLMLGIPYFLIRRSVQRMKYELERDFHFWIK